MLEIPGQSVQFQQNGRLATLSVGDAAVIDEPAFPKIGPMYAAREDFKVSWESTGALTTLEDRSKYFQTRGYPARASGEFNIVVPELSFSFRGKATSSFAFLGSEVNGYYFMQGEQPRG